MDGMKEARGIDRLLALMARLRDPERGCAWDRAQNFSSIAPYTLEEAYEVAEAIERNDAALLKEELGDLLFQVVFHGRMAEEAGLFDFDEIASDAADKMIRRHPHVFERPDARDAAGQTIAWEAMKAEERKAKAGANAVPSALDGVTPALPALTRAVKIQARAARVGFDWSAAADVLDKIAEETREVVDAMEAGDGAQIEAEIGDLLFAVANLARKLKIDAEGALRRGTLKFERRFRAMEAILARQDETIDAQNLEALEALWRQVKREE
jgi:MazG family protein